MPQICPQPIICIAVIFSTLMAGDSSVVPCPWHLAPISGHCAQLASQGLLPSRAGPPWPSPWKAGITLELGASRCGWAHVVQSPAAQMGRTVKARGTWATSPSGGSPSGVSPDREQGHLREGSGGSEAPCRCHSLCSVLISSGLLHRKAWIQVQCTSRGSPAPQSPHRAGGGDALACHAGPHTVGPGR